MRDIEFMHTFGHRPKIVCNDCGEPMVDGWETEDHRNHTGHASYTILVTDADVNTFYERRGVLTSY